MDLIGVDIGGTFTDAVYFDESSGSLHTAKVSSTPEQPDIGLMNCLAELDVDVSSIDMLLHGTTVTTNAVLERNGADCGLITTEGFRDVLEVGWRDRPQHWGLRGEYEPIIPRTNRYGVTERTDSDGTVLQSVSTDEIQRVAEELRADGVEAIAICFLNSFENDRNERQAEAALREVWPNNYIVRSSEVMPEIREFRRTSTTVVSGYTQPVLASYLDRLMKELGEKEFESEVWLVQSNGGLASAEVSKGRPAHTILSGPSAGATAASYLAGLTGHDNVISCDMGGTSFDVALLPGGDPVLTQETEIAYQVPLRIPMTDISTIASGGGSKARVVGGATIRTGPDSAGADPGPVCYGRGGRDITITDANLVLRRINPNDPIGEQEGLAVKKTENLLRTEIADPLNLTGAEAAQAVIDVAVTKMVGELRKISIEQGHDPREFVLVVFGGAGPLHACELLRESDIRRAIIPYSPGTLSALGCVVADARHDNVQGIDETVSNLDIGEFRDTIADLETDGRALLDDAEAIVTDVKTTYEAKMKYEGQSHTVTVTMPSGEPTKDQLTGSFEDAYRQQYSRLVDRSIVVDNIRVSVEGSTPTPDITEFVGASTDGSLGDAHVGNRDVYFDDEWLSTPVYRREPIPLDVTFDGPAIVEQPDTTTVISPGMTCDVDTFGNFILEATS